MAISITSFRHHYARHQGWSHHLARERFRQAQPNQLAIRISRNIRRPRHKRDASTAQACINNSGAKALIFETRGRTQRSAPTRSGSSSGLRFNRSQAESIFGRDVSVLEKYSVTLQYFIRRAEARLLLATAEPVFGDPPQHVLDKVNEANSEKLLDWSRRLRTAQSWTELISD